MSYSGTVHCSWCGQKGHNKLSCPERLSAAEKDPDSYIAAQVRAEKDRRKKQVSSRTCTYCNKPGHNRRGCKLRKADIVASESAQTRYRERFKNALVSAGLGVGTYVRVPTGGWGQRWESSYSGLITKIHWHNVDILNMWNNLANKIVNKDLFTVVVTGTRNQPPEEHSWHSIEVGQKRTIRNMHFAHMMPDVFSEDAVKNSEYSFANDDLMVLLSRSERMTSAGVPMTRDLDYQLALDSGASSKYHPYGARTRHGRLSCHSDVWKIIYPEEQQRREIEEYLINEN